MSDFAERQKQLRAADQQAQESHYAKQLKRIQDLLLLVVAHLEKNTHDHDTQWVSYEDPSDGSHQEKFCWVIASSSNGDGDSYTGITTDGVMVGFYHRSAPGGVVNAVGANRYDRIPFAPLAMSQTLSILEQVLQPPVAPPPLPKRSWWRRSGA